jgi:protection-of-telomeres protein 1
LTHYNSKISAYEASKIPKPPGEASCALYPPTCTKDATPTVKESTFVSQLYHNIDKYRLPSKEEYQVMVVTSANVKNKFSLLRDVKDGQFCDIVTQVVRPPHDAGDKVTIWVSDYTENPAFYKFSIGMDGSSFGRDGDPYGYTDKFMVETASSQWPGPYGQRCLQITCWEPHATIVRESKIEPLTWVSIKNLQIKISRNGSNLEGYLREDRGSFGTKIGIQAIDSNADSENFDPRAKEALQRKREYDRLRKGQIKEIKEASKAGQKRKNCVENTTEQKKENAKARRNAKRKNKNNKQDQIDDQVEQDTIHVADLNTNGELSLAHQVNYCNY